MEKAEFGENISNNEIKLRNLTDIKFSVSCCQEKYFCRGGTKGSWMVGIQSLYLGSIALILMIS
jgi:hypothetical protein